MKSFGMSAGTFIAGVDAETGRYSVLGSLPPVPAIHAAMHHYHTQSEVTGISMLCSLSLCCFLVEAQQQVMHTLLCAQHHCTSHSERLDSQAMSRDILSVLSLLLMNQQDRMYRCVFCFVMAVYCSL